MLLVMGALSLGLLAPPGRSDTGAGRVTAVQAPKGYRIQDAALADVNGDGRRDLIVTTSGRHRAFDREMRIHLRTADEYCFPGEPAITLTLPRDVANAIYLFSRPEAAWINGEVIRVDGGEHISGATR